MLAQNWGTLCCSKVIIGTQSRYLNHLQKMPCWLLLGVTREKRTPNRKYRSELLKLRENKRRTGERIFHRMLDYTHTEKERERDEGESEMREDKKQTILYDDTVYYISSCKTRGKQHVFFLFVSCFVARSGTRPNSTSVSLSGVGREYIIYIFVSHLKKERKRKRSKKKESYLSIHVPRIE